MVRLISINHLHSNIFDKWVPAGETFCLQQPYQFVDSLLWWSVYGCCHCTW